MTDIIALRNEAKELAMKAIDQDDAANYTDAYKTYIKAAEKLQLLIKVDENQYNKEVYKKKAMEYVNRAQNLKKSGSIEQSNEDSKKQVPAGESQ